jgi:hypothetical protein
VREREERVRGKKRECVREREGEREEKKEIDIFLIVSPPT